MLSEWSLVQSLFFLLRCLSSHSNSLQTAKSTSMAAPVDSVLSLIGSTPLVRLDKLAKEEGLKCNLYAKVEAFNAGGSVKVRLAPSARSVLQLQATAGMWGGARS